MKYLLILKCRYTGTIVGLGDLSSQWEGSKWKQLKVNINLFFFSFLCKFFIYLLIQVHWDEQTNFQRPDRVSPWEIEPCSPSTSTVSMNKRPRSLMDHSDSLALGSD